MEAIGFCSLVSHFYDLCIKDMQEEIVEEMSRTMIFGKLMVAPVEFKN